MKLILFLCLFPFLAGCAANPVIYPVSPTYDEMFTTKTKDGWSLAIHHYPPIGEPQQKPPVILCHGLNQNYLSWDLMPPLSFARYLADHGYDVWSVSLRGSGKSTKPGWVQFLELNQLKLDLLDPSQFDHSKFNWNIDDHITKDIPTLIQFIRNKTGSEEVTWIGHSMGGLILVAYLGLTQDPAVKNAILIGVMGKVEQPPSEILQRIVTQEELLRMSLFINTKNISIASAPFSDTSKGALQILSYNQQNMSKEALARFHSHVVENSSPGVVTQMKLLVQTGDFLSADGAINYSANIPNVKANLLCLAGKLDNMAPPGSVLSIYHKAQSPDKTYRLFGIANGYSADYGHNDLLLGKKAPEEVYPYILSWLNAH